MVSILLMVVFLIWMNYIYGSVSKSTYDFSF